LGLLYIEYVFHVTLMLAYNFLAMLMAGEPEAAIVRVK
jgi:hypothetical protein